MAVSVLAAPLPALPEAFVAAATSVAALPLFMAMYTMSISVALALLLAFEYTAPNWRK